MLLSSAWAMALAVVLAQGNVDAPVQWSPDGAWVAYTMAVRPRDRVVPPGDWLFEPAAAGALTLPLAEPEAASLRPSAYRLWATRADTGESVLLEQSAGPITSPDWSPNGSALAFGRLVPEGAGQARFEIVVQDAPRHQRVVLSTPVAEFRAEEGAEGLPGLAPAWSPDGRYLAVPQLKPPGIAIVRSDNGRVLKTIEGAFMPSWSPDGAKLAFYRDENPLVLCTLTYDVGPPKQLLALGRAPQQPPVWSRDSRSVVVVRSEVERPASGMSFDRPELLRVRIDTERREKVRTLNDENHGEKRSRSMRGVTFSFDRDAEDLFYSADFDAPPFVITWARPREGSTQRVFNPLHLSVPIASVAVSPTGKLLAMRIGPHTPFAPPAFCDPESEKLIPIVPDDAVRVEWIGALGRTVRTIVQAQAIVSGGHGAPDRATILPVPGEIAPNHDVAYRLRRLGRIGKAVCERSAEAAPPDAGLQRLLDQAQVMSQYLAEDYAAALDSLPALEQHTSDPMRRLRLLGLRAQIYLGLRDSERADAAVAYLQAAQPRQVLRFEMAASGPVLTNEPIAGARWAEDLAAKADVLRRSGKLFASDDDPNVNTNFDAPQPGLGLDQQPENLLPVVPMGNGELFRVDRIPNQQDVRARLGLPPDQPPPPPQPARRRRR